MNLKLKHVKTKLYLGVVFPLILIAILSLISYSTINRLIETIQWVEHTHNVIQQAQKIEKSIIDMETGERGFLITGKDAFLEPYYKGLENQKKFLLEAKQLVNDNPSQSLLLDKIERKVELWQDMAALPEINNRKKFDQGLIAQSEIQIEAEIGKDIMDSLRILLDEFKTNESDLLKTREAESSLMVDNVLFNLVWGTILVALLIILTMSRMAKSIVNPLTDLVDLSSKVKKGDLSARGQVTRDDEFGILVTTINSMLDSLQAYTIKQDKTESELREHKNHLEDLVSKKTKQLLFRENALNEHAIVSITDIKGRITFANEKFEQISQYSQDEILGQNHRIIKSDFHPDSFFKDMWQTIANGHVWHGDIQNKAKDGSLYWVSSTFVPQLNEQGKPEQYISIRTDVTNIKKLEQQQLQANDLLLAEQEITSQSAKRLDTIIETAMDASIQIDANGLIIGWNVRAEEIFGWLKGDAIGREMQTLIIPEQYRKQHLKGIKRCLVTGESSLFNTPTEITALNSKGIEFPIEISVSIVNYNNEYQFSAFIRDLTQQKEYEKSILDSQNEANKANKAKSEFLSSMSHELRTPLNAILGFGQLLDSDIKQPLTKDQKDNVGTILSSGYHLLNLVNDILDLSTIEAGQLDVSIEPIHLIELIADIKSLMGPIATKATVQFNIESKQDLLVLADYTKLKQVLINLISNAIKYNTQNGCVTINWASTNQNTLKLNIIDTGIGVPTAKQGKVFSAFNRLGQEISGIEGTGIGLVVTKDLIELMDGTIGFDSTEGKGSTFWLELPLAEKQSVEVVRSVESEAKDTISEISNGDSKQVLYVEDNPANRRLMQSIFKRLPHTLTMAESGEIGMQSALEHDFDLILMDINLPGIDGKEVTTQLRESEYYKNKAIIAVSAAAMSHNIQSAEGLFDDYITKPVDIKELINLLNKHLS